MKTALFAWELGANLGHAGPMAEIARGLVQDGLRVVVVGRDVDSLAIAFSKVDALRLQAPVWPYHRHWGSEETQANFLDVLVHSGFGDATKLAAIVDAWRSLLSLVEPDLIVADHSPGLLAATYGSSIPVIGIGTGFTMPPLELGRFPPLRSDRGPIAPEPRMLEGLRGLLPSSAPPPGRLVDLFQTTRRFVFSFPELDPYRAFRQEPLYLPPETLPAFVPPPVEPRLFVYLGAETSGLEVLAQALVEIAIPAVVYLRGDAGPLSNFLAMRGVEVHTTPPRLADVLPLVSHVICAGGAFTCHAALAAGRPLMIMPQHGESALNLRLTEGMGFAQRLDHLKDAEQVGDAIEAFVQNHRLTSAAAHWAGVVGLREQPNGAEAVRSAVRELI